MGAHERLLAEQVDDAQRASRIKINGVESFGREYFSRLGSAEGEAALDVFVRFGDSERSGAATERDSLAELEKLRRGEQGVEFGLARENNLDQLFAFDF